LAEKRMLIVPDELAQKIDDNRGEMSRGEFLDFLIDSQLKEVIKDKQLTVQYVTKEDIKTLATREELKTMEQDLKALLKNFLDFFLSYGLEIGKEPKDSEFAEIANKLKGIDKEAAPDKERGRATIKWK
jgi:hypothetical protein